jgi:hypothetical protein
VVAGPDERQVPSTEPAVVSVEHPPGLRFREVAGHNVGSIWGGRVVVVEVIVAVPLVVPG